MIVGGPVARRIAIFPVIDSGRRSRGPRELQGGGRTPRDEPFRVGGDRDLWSGFHDSAVGAAIRDSGRNEVTSSTASADAIPSRGATEIGTTGFIDTLAVRSGTLTVSGQSIRMLGADSVLEVATAPAGFTNGTTSAISVAGLSTFTGLSLIETAGNANSLSFAQTGPIGTSTAVTPTIGAVTELGIVTTVSSSIEGSSLGRGNCAPTCSNPPGLRQTSIAKAAPSVKVARDVSVTVNQPTALRLTDGPKDATLKVQVNIGASWKSVGGMTLN